MKRGRGDDRVLAPNTKRHESIPANRAQALVHDPIAYFRLIKEVFKDNNKVSDEFCKLMHDYRARSIDIPELVAKVKVLFKDHENLILGFSAFLPDGIEVDDHSKRPVDFEQAINYVQKVKARFHHDAYSYHKFIEILHKYRNGNQSTHGVYEEVSQLLKNYPDLLVEFTCFLPEEKGACSIQQVKALPSTPPQVERINKREIEDNLVHDESNSDEADDLKYPPWITAKSDPDHGKKRQKEKDRDGSKEKQFDENPNGVERTLLLRKAVDLQVHSGTGSRGVAKSTSPRPLGERFIYNCFQKQVDFLTHVKGSLPKSDSFQEILDYIYLHCDGRIGQGDLGARVGAMFQDCPKLTSGFKDFVSQHTTKELEFLSSRQQGNLREQSEKWVAEGWREKGEKGDTDHSTSVREKCGKEDNDQWTKEVELERKTEEENEIKKHSSRDMINHKATVCNKYLNKPVSGLDLSKCEQCTPSYRLLPDDYPLPKVGSRTCLGHAVLNDTWVSVTFGSEDYSFKQMRKNQYEETLNKCEDDRYELDMLLASVGAEIRSLEELLEKIMNPDIQEDTHIDDYLTGSRFRCIERIYGDHSLDFLDSMRQNPTVGLPVILNRLKQKQDEWLKCQADMGNIWAEVFAKNYHKSLDEGLLYFKQQDQKNLSTKALLAEIKESNAMKRKSNDFIISMACGNTMPVIPDLILEYPDSGIKDDFYQILKHSAKELCPNVEQSARVLHVWKIFLEPLCHSFQESEKVCKCESMKSQDIVTSSNNISLHGERTLTNAELQTGMPPMNDEVDTSRQDFSEAYALHTSETHQDAGRQCSRYISDEKIASPMAKCMSMDCCRDDVNQLEYPEREEREEGEISPSDSPAENTLLEYVTEHCSGCCTGKKGREVDHNGGNEYSAKEFDENEKACTHRFSKVSKNGESESGEEQSDGDAEGTAPSDGGGLVNDRVLQRCKPLFSKDASTSFALEGNTVVFYGSDSMYILLRLHEALYERIHTAKVNAAAKERKQGQEKVSSSFELYHKFLRSLYGFLDGTADSTKFEDVCRLIGGNKFYLFLTIDKLIFKFVKQLQAVATDEMAMKLLALHAYEQSHAPGGLIDAVYHANASMLLHDENVYRFEQRAGQLFIQLMEGPLERGEALTSAMHSTFANNLSNFLLMDSLERSQRDPLFLKRNRVSCALDDNAEAGLLKDVLIVNGLELNMSCTTYKITYMLNTEDFLYRKKHKSRKFNRVKDDKFMSKAAFKFHRWLDGQM